MLSRKAGFVTSAPNPQSQYLSWFPCAVAVHTARCSVPAFRPVLGTARTFYTTLLTFRHVKILIAFLCLAI